MILKEKFISASVNPRSHCLVACQTKPLIVYASQLQLAVQTVPKTEKEVGVIRRLSERRHNKPITCLKRVKSTNSDDFATGGVDSKIVLWRLNEETEDVEFVENLEGCSGSIGSVCGTKTASQTTLIAATWVSESSSGLRCWWISPETGSIDNFDIILENSAFALCLDAVEFENTVLLAAGTSKRFVELYGEADDRKSFQKLISVAGHTDWIHSIAFNDNSSNLLLASAGQDTYVRLWSIDNESSSANIDKNEEEELTSVKNAFKIGEIPMKISSYAVMQGHDDWAHSTSWNSDGTILLTASSDKTCIIWREIDNLWRDDVRLGIVGGQAAGFFASVFCDHDNSIISSSYFGGLHGWRAEDEGKTFWTSVTMTGGHVGEVRDCVWQKGADGESAFLISVGEDQTTRVFANYERQNTMVEIARPQVHGHDMQCISMVTPSVFVSGAEEKIFRAFRAPKSFLTSLASISSIDTSKSFGDSKIADFGACVPALGLSNKSMGEGETVEGEHWEEEGFRATPTILSYPPSEDVLQRNTLWPEEHKLYGHGYEVYSVAVNPTSKVLATACKSSHQEFSVIILWNTENWSKRAELSGHQLTVTQIAWNRSGTLLLSVSRDRTARLYKEKNGNIDGFEYECVWTSTKQHSRIIWACDWFENNEQFVTVSRDQKVIVWNVKEDYEAVPIASTKWKEPITAVAVSNGDLSSALIAAGSQSGEIIIFRVKEAELEAIQVIGANAIPIDAAVLRLRFSNSRTDRQLLAASTADSKLRVFEVSTN